MWLDRTISVWGNIGLMGYPGQRSIYESENSWKSTIMRQRGRERERER